MRNRFNLNEEDKKHIRGLHGIQLITEQEVTFTQILDDTKKPKDDGISFIEHSENITNVTNHYAGKESSGDYPIIPGDGTIKFVYVQGSTRNEVISNISIETKPKSESYQHTITFDLDTSKQDRSMGNTIGAHIEITGLESGYHQVIMPLENYWMGFNIE